ncbi:hypothetical protein BG006_005518 [Podila minutissima]|uniref:Uncharacterized protein n=1 Tax=Podila minutissima TaxID=64525 RepID=A0A9P5VLQ2_9FUNG|nr:hypothetical protein BG006_005518 [Podila minutissima]
MFYSKEILARKDTNLGRIWLAATIGPRSRLSRLSKKEVNGVDIVRTCRDISQPPEPLALRLSSNLLMGVVRVYSQQVNNYAADVNSTWARIKRDLALVQAEQLELANPVARLEAITNDYDMDIEQELTRPNNILLDWELEVSRSDRCKQIAVEFGWALPSQASMDDSSDNFSSPNALLFDKTDERRRRITLDEDRKLRSPAGHDFGDQFGLSLGDDDMAGDDSGLYLDAEGNLVETMPDRGLSTADMGDTEPPIQKAPQIEKTADVDRGEMDHVGMEIDEQLVPVDQNVPDVDETDNIQPPDTATNQFVAQTPAKGSHQKCRKLKGLIVDEATTLPRDALAIPRSVIEQELTRLSRSDNGGIRSARETKALVDSLFQGPFCVSGYAPELSIFWATASARSAHPVQSLLPLRPPDHVDDDLELPRHIDHDLDSLGGEFPDPEVIRRHPGDSSDRSTPAGLGFGGGVGFHDGEAGVGPMPWSGAYDFPPSAGGRSDRSPAASDHGQEFQSIFDASVVPQKRLSMGGGRTRGWGSDEEEGEDTLVRRRLYQGNTGSVAGSGSGEAQFTFGSEDVTGLGNDATSQPQETVKFLKYVRTMLKDAGASPNSWFSFSDVVPVQERRQVAASAFYHILALSSASVVRPYQDTPYGDIQVQFCNETLSS